MFVRRLFKSIMYVAKFLTKKKVYNVVLRKQFCVFSFITQYVYIICNIINPSTE